MKKQNKKPNRKYSFFVCFCLVALSAYFVVSLVAMNRQIKATKDEIAEIHHQCEVQNAENEKLRSYIESGDIDGYVEEIARDDLGYVKPGERVYYDISVNS